MVYPDTRGDQQHYLACFDLRNGAEYWKQPVEGEVITAPIVADDHVYLATLEGTLYCFNAKDGTRVWQEEKNATSSPVVWNQQCYFSQREEVPLAAVGKAGWQQRESLSGRGVDAGAPTRRYHKTTRDADYLDHEKRLAGSPRFMACETADAGVGFGMHKGDAKMAQAIKNLGHSHVSGIWAYQGSKPFLSRGRLYSALGDTVHCVDPQSEEVLWKKNLHQTREQNELLDSVVTPPALVNGKVFVGTILGDVCCLSADSGEMLWVIHVGEPVAFQVAVAGGRVYAPTAEGSLFCLETGNPDDDGWLMWGATAAHNGLVE
jgi:outer membrane protein assembly factor BamB